ncbi:MAG: hypothetical protein J6S45_00410, partial [Firmicutes bacterium]|nr:hypothetical protein [Bacillota bacterium]
MMKRNVRVMALLLALILALSLMMTGCGGGTGSEGESTDQTEQTGDAESEAKPDSEDTVFLSTWRPMGANRPVKYFLSGGIDYEYVTDEDIAAKIADLSEPDGMDISLNGSYCIIKGLVNEEVQNIINQQIYDLYLDMCERTELPGY